MGSPMMFYASDKIKERLLKEDNRSKIINAVLEKYFDEVDLNNMTEEELELELKIIDEKEKYEQRIKEMRENGGKGKY